MVRLQPCLNPFMNQVFFYPEDQLSMSIDYDLS